jgi:hypothetical protein
MARYGTLAWCVFIAALSLTSHAVTITLAPVADTTLFETDPGSNLGAETTLIVGTTNHGFRDRALLLFDVASKIPAGSVITSAQLFLNVTKESGVTAKNSNFELRRMLLSWKEGKKTGGSVGAPASPGETTWNARLAPNTLWNQPGAAETNDYSAVSSATLPMNMPGSYIVHSTPSLIADVQSWLDQPDANYGWLVRCDSESVSGTARRIASREDKARAPGLRIDYTPGPPPFLITSITRSKTSGTIAWTGGNAPFQLQRKLSLDLTNWTDFGLPLLTNSAVVPFDTTQSFFRVTEKGTP